jgi:hypothetical protein
MRVLFHVDFFFFFNALLPSRYPGYNPGAASDAEGEEEQAKSDEPQQNDVAMPAMDASNSRKRKRSPAATATAASADDDDDEFDAKVGGANDEAEQASKRPRLSATGRPVRAARRVPAKVPSPSSSEAEDSDDNDSEEEAQADDDDNEPGDATVAALLANPDENTPEAILAHESEKYAYMTGEFFVLLTLMAVELMA